MAQGLAVVSVAFVQRTAALLAPTWLLASALALTGCQLYWTKLGGHGYVGEFGTDHRDCVIAAGRPIPNDDRLLVELNLYRACLRSRGWERVTGSKAGNPPGYMRGLEDEGPVRPGDLPEQVPTMSPVYGRRGSGTNFGPR